MNDDYFTEITEIDGQKGIESLENKWMCEISELLALTRNKDVEAVKSFLSRMVDRYRRAYTRFVIDVKRKCVFIGTTNKTQFLTDKTGNRRFLPIKVYSESEDLYSNEKEIKEYIKQCWAEALFKYKQGKLPNVENHTLKDVIKMNQIDALEDDYREGMIEEYLKFTNKTCVLQIWADALGNGDSKPSKKDSNEIGLIMNNKKNWNNVGNRRYDKYGSQKSWEKVGI